MIDSPKIVINTENAGLLYREFELNGNAIYVVVHCENGKIYITTVDSGDGKICIVAVDSADGKVYITAADGKLVITPTSANVVTVSATLIEKAS